jgi:HEAT repeat protein
LADPDTAVAATYALGRIGHLPADVDSAITANAKSSDLMLSTVSLWALANTHPDDKRLRARVTKQLIHRLNDEDPYVRTAAARGLAALPPDLDVTMPIWQEELKNADETMLAHSLDALSQIGAPAVPALVKALQYDELRPHVIKMLLDLGPEAAGAAPALAKYVNDADEDVALEVIVALTSFDDRAAPAVPALIESIEREGNPHAHTAIYALGRIGPAASDAQNVLLDLLGGSDQNLALISAWSLTKINPSSAIYSKVVPVFVAGLNSPKAKQRRGAAISLGQLGNSGASAAAALERALKDTDESVRNAAKRALAEIRE